MKVQYTQCTYFTANEHLIKYNEWYCNNVEIEWMNDKIWMHETDDFANIRYISHFEYRIDKYEWMKLIIYAYSMQKWNSN